MGTGSFPGVKYGRGVLLITHSLLMLRWWKSRPIPLPTLWATTGPVTGTLDLYLWHEIRSLCHLAGGEHCFSLIFSVNNHSVTPYHLHHAAVQISTIDYSVCQEYTNPWETRFYTETPSNIVRIIKSRRLRWAGHVTRIGDWRSWYRLLLGKPEGNRPLGRPRRRWEDKITMDL